VLQSGALAPFVYAGDKDFQRKDAILHQLIAPEALAVYSIRMDRSNGYEAVSEEFLARRGK
jgi:hypothetical protein